MHRLLPLTLLCACAVVMLASPASADTLTDGSLVLDVTSNGRFDVISLNGTSIDTSSYVQQQYVNGSSFGGGSAVSIVGSTATYTASAGGLSVSATSTILGALAGSPSSSVFQQVFTITNNTGGAVSLESVSFLDPDVGNTTSNRTAYDAGTQSVYAWAPSIAGLLFASTANSSEGTFGYHNANLGTLSPKTFANLNGANGPVGTSDIEHAVGLSYGTLAAGQSTTFSFQYLFGTNLSAVPGNFGFGAAVPEPGTLALLGLGLAGLAFAGRRRRNK